MGFLPDWLNAFISYAIIIATMEANAKIIINWSNVRKIISALVRNTAPLPRSQVINKFTATEMPRKTTAFRFIPIRHQFKAAKRGPKKNINVGGQNVFFVSGF